MKHLAPAAMVLALTLSACGGEKADEAAATAEPEAISTDYVIENPTDPAVPVDLPSTAMTTAPEASPSPQ